MAALVAGVQYGLSSHSNFHENKSLIFVKLTDSAQRAIEDFIRNRNKLSQNPTIRFQGNEGQLCFPSTQSNHGATGFTFSLSGNQDIEGPQGGFECIQQTGPESLQSLGALPCKMRIQANDDVYETTRHRMAVAEENSKNKCTRVIKANGPDIGRKVKVKSTGRPTTTTTTTTPSNLRHRESTSIPSVSSHSRLSSSSSSTTSATTTSSSSCKPTTNNNPPARNQPEKKILDIMRRPLKERLIHLLALRPYKKPELYDRINREGIKERERSAITTILKQIAFMRDNTYHLQRYVWNDVQEDWPYYTEQEKAMLKRRKPQNLTPPGSSDGSSGSGQSPNSTHPGSPPAITAPPASLLTSKRPGYYQGNDGLPTKRPRISHYKKSEASSNSSTTTSSGDNGRTTGSSGGSGGGGGTSGNGSNGSNGSNGGNAGNGGNSVSAGSVTTSASSGGIGSIGGNNGNSSEPWEMRQHQQRRMEYRLERITNSYGHAANKPCLTPTSDSEESSQSHREGVTESNTANTTNSHNSHNSLAHSNSLSAPRHYGHSAKSTINSADSNQGVASAGDYGVYGRNASSAGSGGTASNVSNATNVYEGSSNGAYLDRRDRNERTRNDKDRETRKRNNAESTNNCEVPSTGSTTAYTNNGDANVPPSSSTPTSPESPKPTEYPDYLTYYTSISSMEQRRRYKAEFNADYEEYRRLHGEVVNVAQRFVDLEERLNQVRASGNWNEFEEVRQQILLEYSETKNDPVHIETKRRFHYLHDKLSHIKRLVLEYDLLHGIANMIPDGYYGNSNTDIGAEVTRQIDSLQY